MITNTAALVTGDWSGAGGNFGENLNVNVWVCAYWGVGERGFMYCELKGV